VTRPWEERRRTWAEAQAGLRVRRDVTRRNRERVENCMVGMNLGAYRYSIVKDCDSKYPYCRYLKRL